MVDDGTELDLMLDPPIAVADAARRAVRRWRLERIAVAHPALIPDEPDITVPVEPDRESRTHVIDFADTLSALIRPRGRAQNTCPTFEAWTPECRAYLNSAICGG
eukprot:3935927-Karenia_brevis.AAC.1